jgi:hypothetical protein
MAEALEKMNQLASQQGQVGQQSGGMLPLMGAGGAAVQEQLRQLWRAYAASREQASEPLHQLLARAARSCGARLLQSAYEWSYGELTLPRNAVAALQLGVNILQVPVDSSLTMLGLGAEPGLAQPGS